MYIEIWILFMPLVDNHLNRWHKFICAIGYPPEPIAQMQFVPSVLEDNRLDNIYLQSVDNIRLDECFDLSRYLVLISFKSDRRNPSKPDWTVILCANEPV